MSWVDLSHFESLASSNIVEEFTYTTSPQFLANKYFRLAVLLACIAVQNLTLCNHLRSPLVPVKED